MGGIVFPNVANALLPLIQMDRQAEESRLNRDRLERHDQWMMEDRKEQRGLQKQQFQQTLDEKQRLRLKEASDWTAQAALGVLGTPEAQRPAAYQAALQEGKTRGYDISTLPPQYSPGMDGMLQFYVKKAQSVNDYLKQQADSPQPMGPGGGGPATVAPDATKKGGEFVSHLTGKHGLSPVAAGGVVGGLFQESGFDPGYGFTRPGGDNGTAFGMGQWRLDRAKGLQTFAQQQGKPPTDPTVQLDYLVHEMKGGDMGAQRAFAMLQQAKTAEEATTAMMHFFRPAGYTPNNPQGGHGYQQRVQYAQRFMPQSMMPGGPPAAEMPNVSAQQAGARPGNPAAMPGDFSPTNTPASAMPLPQMPPQGGGEGTGMPGMPSADDPIAALRAMQLPPGVRFVGKQGVPMIQGDRVLIQLPDNTRQWVPMPAKKDPNQNGPLAGTGMDQQMMNVLLSGDPGSQQYAAAYAYMSRPRTAVDPATGQMTAVQPMDMSMFSQPGIGRGGQPTGPAPLPQGATQAQIPGGGTATTLPGKGKALDNSARDDLAKAARPVLELTELLKSFDPSFGGYIAGGLGDAANFAKRNLPDALGGADPKGQAQWWQRYNMFANLERNVLFGSALTPTEKAAFEAAMVNPGMKPDQITANLARQQEIAGKALSRMTNSMAAGGTNREAIEAATGTRMSDQPDPIGGVPQAPPGGAKGVGPKPGTVEQGYVFRGGDPADKSNWSKVK